MATKPAPGPKRTPKGVDTNRPIALRLRPEERKQAERVAKKLNVSRSNLARLAYLNGLPLLLAEHEKGSTA